MKKIPLTQGKYALVDDEAFEWLNQWSWCFFKGYAIRGQRYGPRKENKTRFIYMHRQVLERNGISLDNLETDHINRDKLDNQKGNLRPVSSSLNKWNVGLQSNNKSGIKGVSWGKRDKRWITELKAYGKVAYRGIWKSKLAAILAYKLAEKKYRSDLRYLEVTNG